MDWINGLASYVCWGYIHCGQIDSEKFLCPVLFISLNLIILYSYPIEDFLFQEAQFDIRKSTYTNQGMIRILSEAMEGKPLLILSQTYTKES